MPVSMEGHRERMRRRAEQMDKEDIRSQELVELMLYYALPRRDTREQAAALMERFGSLEEMFRAEPQQIASVPGVGPGAARWLHAVGRLFHAYRELDADDRPLIYNRERAQRYLTKFLNGLDYPEVWQLCLSTGGRLLGAERIAECAAWGEPEYLRQALGSAMTLRAHSVIIGQFSVTPMGEVDGYDVEKTMGYSHTLNAAGIQLLDHLIVYPDGVISMYADGKLDRMHQLIKDNSLRENYLLRENDDSDDIE